MEPTVEVSTFPDGRLKVIVRFYCIDNNSGNFRTEGNGEYTWCPNLDEPKVIAQTLEAIDEYNEKNRRKENSKMKNLNDKLIFNSTFR
jgi:hypothetical protein